MLFVFVFVFLISIALIAILTYFVIEFIKSRPKPPPRSLEEDFGHGEENAEVFELLDDSTEQPWVDMASEELPEPEFADYFPPEETAENAQEPADVSSVENAPLMQQAAQPHVEADQRPVEAAQTFDKLTGLKMGRLFLVEAQRLLDAARECGETYAVACFDIDRFRFINSLKGYAIGDYSLAHIGQALDGIFPVGSLASRLSADHFAVVFPFSDAHMLDEVMNGLNRVCARIKDDITIKSGLRLCMGYAVARTERDYDITILLARANVARHCAKITRLDAPEAFVDSMISSYLYGETALEDFKELQYDDDFHTYYQGINDLNRNRMFGCEALTLWRCEEEAARVMPLSSDTGLLPTNNLKVIYNVCKTIARWRKAGKESPPIMIALPIIDLLKSDIDAFFARLVSEFQIEPELLQIVIPASVIRADWTTAANQIGKIKEIGVRIGVSGIDTGFMSIDFLKGLPIDFIKLHRGFVHHVTRSEERADKLRNMLEMAGAQNLRVIFEGVDYFDQMNFLTELGVRFAQGKIAGPHMNAEDFGRTLPEYATKLRHETVILGDASLTKGDFKVY